MINFRTLRPFHANTVTTTCLLTLILEVVSIDFRVDKWWAPHHGKCNFRLELLVDFP